MLRTELALSGEKQRPFFLAVLSLQDMAQTQAASSPSLPRQKELHLSSVLSFLTVCPHLIKWQASVTIFIKHKGVAVSVLAVFIQNHEVQTQSSSVYSVERPVCDVTIGLYTLQQKYLGVFRSHLSQRQVFISWMVLGHPLEIEDTQRAASGHSASGRPLSWRRLSVPAVCGVC